MSAFDVRDLLKTAEPCAAKVGEAMAAADTLADPAPFAPTPVSGLRSPVVLAGGVRIFEFLLLTAIGFALRGVAQHRAAIIDMANAAAIAALAVGLFQVARAYRMMAFQRFPRTAIKLLVGWSLALAPVAVVLATNSMPDFGAQVRLVSLFALGLTALLLHRAVLQDDPRRQNEGALETLDQWTVLRDGRALPG